MEQIIFFDGACNLCNGFVDFLIKFDRNGQYKIASLQGQTAKALLPENYHQELSTIVFLKNGKISTKSEAVLLIVTELGPLWKILKIFNFFPFKDFFYQFISKNRYRLFGQRKNCRLPSSEEQTRFLP